MKIRTGFVSNSSSASFMVPKSRMSIAEGVLLLGFPSAVKNNDGWNIYEDGDCIRGSTSMDNDRLDEYLTKNGFKAKIEWWCD